MKIACILSIAGTTALSALEIRIDYTYDSTNFFDTPEKRHAMEAVAAFFGDMIQDSMLRIDQSEFPGGSWTADFMHPGTGLGASIPGLVIPEDTLIVFVGGHNLGGTVAGRAGPGGYGISYSGSGNPDPQLWFDLVTGRGNAEAATPDLAQRTDFSLWGGSIAFDNDRTWNFSLTQNQAGTDFVSVAKHEMGHLLGIGTADSWLNRISGAGKFTGPAVTRSLGIQPSVTLDAGHFAPPQVGTLVSPAFGAFGMSHGVVRPVLMLASSLDDGINLDGAGDLDLAALVDCGWEILPDAVLSAITLGPASSTFNWPSSSFFDYQVQRSVNLQSFPVKSPLTAGDGSVRTWSDPSPVPGSAFYRLAAMPVGFPEAAPVAAMLTGPVASPTFFKQEPRMVGGCECGSH